MTWFEHIAELLSKDIDRELVRRQLELTPTQRLEKLEEMRALMEEARRARATAPQAPARRTG